MASTRPKQEKLAAFGREVYQLRNNADISRTKFIRLIERHLSQNHPEYNKLGDLWLARIESGGRTHMSCCTVHAIAKVLEHPHDEAYNRLHRAKLFSLAGITPCIHQNNEQPSPMLRMFGLIFMDMVTEVAPFVERMVKQPESAYLSRKEQLIVLHNIVQFLLDREQRAGKYDGRKQE